MHFVSGQCPIVTFFKCSYEVLRLKLGENEVLASSSRTSVVARARKACSGSPTIRQGRA